MEIFHLMVTQDKSHICLLIKPDTCQWSSLHLQSFVAFYVQGLVSDFTQEIPKFVNKLCPCSLQLYLQKQRHGNNLSFHRQRDG